MTETKMAEALHRMGLMGDLTKDQEEAYLRQTMKVVGDVFSCMTWHGHNGFTLNDETVLDRILSEKLCVRVTARNVKYSGTGLITGDIVDLESPWER